MFKLIFIVVVLWMLGCGSAMLCEKQVNISIASPNASTWDCYVGGPPRSNRRVMFTGDVVCPPLLNWRSSVLVGDGRVVGGMCEPEGLVTPWHGPPSRAVKLLSEARTTAQISSNNGGWYSGGTHLALPKPYIDLIILWPSRHHRGLMGSESNNNKAHTSIKKDDMINNKWGLVAGRGCSPCISRKGSEPPLYKLRRVNMINNMTGGSRAGTPLLPNPRSCSPKQGPATAEGRHTAWCPYLKATTTYLTGIDDDTSLLIVSTSDTLVCECEVGVGYPGRL